MDVCWFNFADLSKETLIRVAQPILDPSSNEKPPDRITFWAGRAAIATLLFQNNLSYYLKSDSVTGQIRLVDANGESKQWWVSLAHTESVVVAALSPAPVGIDIESRTRDTKRAIHRLLGVDQFQAAEASFLERGVEPAEVPVYLWTGLEAIGKSTGKGVLLDRSAYEIDWLTLKIIFKGQLAQASDFIVNFFPREQYVVAICTTFSQFDPMPKWCDIRLA